MVRMVMRLAVLALVIGVGGMRIAGPAAAQEADVWIQIEARSNRGAAEDRARHWAAELPQVAGFALASGWHAVALGPYPAAEATARLGELRASGSIPPDSFIADGRLFRSQFWPPADMADTAAQPEPTTPTTPAEQPEGALAAIITPPPAVTPTETLADARRDDAGLRREQRLDIQRALQWFGTYDSGIDGAFGPGTRGAISAWQAIIGATETGYLTPSQRRQLVADWQADVAAMGMESVTDNEAGIAADLPLGLVGFDRYTPPFAQYGPRGDSGMQIWLISAPGDQAVLDGLFELIQSLAILPPDGPRNRRPQSFDLSGMDAEVETWAEAEIRQGAIRGFLITARSSDTARTTRIRQALKASFRAMGNQVLDPGLEPLDDATRASLLTGVELRRPRHAGSGFYVDESGAVLTATANVAGCARITLDAGQVASIERQDDAAGVALLRPDQRLAPTNVALLAADLPAPGSTVAIAGFPYGMELTAPVMTFGRFAAPTMLDGDTTRARLELTALAGDVGAPVLGPDGQVIGVLQPAPDDPTRVLPAALAHLTPAPAIVAALDLSMAATAGPMLVPEDLTTTGLGMVVQVACWD